MAPEVCPVTRKITVFVYSRQEKDITVTCRHRIISEQDIFIRELFKIPSGNGKVFAGGKSPSVKRRTSCVYADLKELHLQMEILKAA